MANTINNQGHNTPLKAYPQNDPNQVRASYKAGNDPEKTDNRQDTVQLNQQANVTDTYSSSLVMESGNEQEQYSLLRQLVTNMLKEQGIDFKVANGDQEIDISTISQEEAVELVSEDGYFGVEKTSARIVDFAIGIAGDDPSRLAAIKEGVEKGFNDALEAFGGTLPDISYETYDAVMNKLDDWAEAGASDQTS